MYHRAPRDSIQYYKTDMDELLSDAKTFEKPASAMEDIVEKFLIEQLNEAIKKVRDTELPGCKHLSVHDDCEKLKKLIEEKKLDTAAAKSTRRENLYYMLNLTTEWLRRFGNQNTSTWAAERLWVERSARATLKQIEKDLAKSHQDDKGGGQPSPDDEGAQQFYRWSSHAVDVEKIHGFHDKHLVMKRLLLKAGSKVIEIVGVPGVGKTALCQVAFNEKDVKERFGLRLWLCLSRQQKLQFNAGDKADAEKFLVKRMLSCVGFEDPAITKIGQGVRGLEKLQAALEQQLKRGPYLIVLDDFWVMEAGDEMGNAIKNMFLFLMERGKIHEGTVLVTSRSGEVKKTFNLDNLHQLKLLPLTADDDESFWKIFEQEAGAKKEEILKDDEQKRLFRINCKGVPLMAKMLGQIYHNLPKKQETTKQKD